VKQARRRLANLPRAATPISGAAAAGHFSDDNCVIKSESAALSGGWPAIEMRRRARRGFWGTLFGYLESLFFADFRDLTN